MVSVPDEPVFGPRCIMVRVRHKLFGNFVLGNEQRVRSEFENYIRNLFRTDLESKGNESSQQGTRSEDDHGSFNQKQVEAMLKFASVQRQEMENIVSIPGKKRKRH